MSKLVEDFERGRYRELVDVFVDVAKPPAVSTWEKSFLVGALCFVGRRADGWEIYRSQIQSFDLDAEVVSRFFLGVAATRDSDYSTGRSLFSRNWLVRGALKRVESRTLVYQGFGFYRNFASRYRSSLLWSNRSWKIAFEGRYLFGMLLASDLKGHNLIQTGEVSRGIKSLEESSRLSTKLGHGGVSEALRVSLACYRAQFGWKGGSSQELQDTLQTLSETDTYSKSNTVLELVRSLILEGRLREASDWAERGSEVIFRSGHRRQRATLHLRKAHIHRLRGEVGLAEREIQDGLANLDPEVDLAHRLELLGLQASFSPDDQALHRQLERLTRLTGRSVARNILARSLRSEVRSSDDPVGSLLNRQSKQPESLEVIEKLMESRWWGPLRRYCQGGCNLELLMDLVPQRLMIFWNGDVWVSQDSLSPILKRTILVLAKGAASKKDLVEGIWGYRYDPLRHDTVIYATIHRLREFLGPYRDILKVDDGNYGWTAACHASVFDRSVTSQVGSGIDFAHEAKALNVRQARILEYLQKCDFVNIEQYSKIFQVSKPTATRDLGELEKKGFIIRQGRARATAYVLRRGNSSNGSQEVQL